MIEKYASVLEIDNAVSSTNNKNQQDPLERKKLMEQLISEIQIYPERQPNGQWLKSIKSRLPIVENDIDLCLDNRSHIECVIALSKGEIDS